MAKKHIIKNRRLGRFEVSIDLINDAYPILSIIFSDILIIVAEVLVERDAIRYVGISDNFDTVLEGAQIPFYNIQVREVEEYLEIDWKKCEEKNMTDPVSIKWNSNASQHRTMNPFSNLVRNSSSTE